MEQSGFTPNEFSTEIPTKPLGMPKPTAGGTRAQPSGLPARQKRPPAKVAAGALPRQGRGYPPGNSSARRQRVRLLALITALWAILAGLLVLVIVYAIQPRPLPELLALKVTYAPHYLFSIYNADQPVGVAYSDKSDRIYVAESGGQRLIKMFNRSGDLLGSFSPPRTDVTERLPIYLAAADDGKVYVSDIAQLAIQVYDPDGNFVDSLLSPDLTLSEYVTSHAAPLQEGATLSYNLFQDNVYIADANGGEQQLPAPGPLAWAPLGVRFAANGDLLLTDVYEDHHVVRTIPGSSLQSSSRRDFNPPLAAFGGNGAGESKFSFPNVAVMDSKGRIYVTDGNNSRISVWDSQGNFLFFFGRGSGESAVNLPRGAVIDQNDRLYIVDAVDHSVKVYDVSGEEVSFLYRFGDFGVDDGQFNYPNDIALDNNRRLYIVDRENNRLQVWSY